MGRNKKAKTAAGQVKVLPKRAPFRKVCNTCHSSWLGDLVYDCGHNDFVEVDI